jgi:tripeptidyl-peptidase-1
MIANTSITSWEFLSADPAYTISDYIYGTQISPATVSSAYNIPVNDGANVKVGIISLGGGWLPSDLQRSMSELGLSQPRITQVNVDNPGNVFSISDSNYSNENTLDLYCVAGMVPKANIVLYMGENSQTGFVNVVNRAVNENCDVISISWCLDESIMVDYNISPYLEGPLANAAARGITVLAASGDRGSSGNSREDPDIGPLSVCYPASSPNVVAVGGTILNTYTGIETVSNESGGGISRLFSVPNWQTGLTYKKYFTSNSSYGPSTTLTGRGVPDISAPYQTYVMYYNGAIFGGGGTSASCPILAGMFARYISITGRRPIPNTIHSLLYSNINAYRDIVSGNNNNPLNEGFAANIGWDPVVGLGAPNGSTVQQIVSSGGTRVKTAANTWGYVANVKVKTATNTWSNVKAIWTKTVTGWRQTY